VEYDVKFSRRRLLKSAAGIGTTAVISPHAFADTFPSRPIRLIVGFPPGGPNDIWGRLAGQWITERLGQPVIVENRPGAASNVAADYLVHSAPDGYTLFLASFPNAINATLYDNLQFNYIRDTAPVAGIARSPDVMEVNPDVPVHTVAEFIAYAKNNRVIMVSSGIGTSMHMSGELLKMMTGIDMQHVPYRGSAPALTDLMAGRGQVMFDAMASSLGYIKAGKLRALAVTSKERSDALPDVPAAADTVPGLEVTAWFGLSAPANTPAEAVSKINTALNDALAVPANAARIAEFGGTPFIASPAEFGKFIADETAKWAKVVVAAGVKPE
jgi:tripartite-type tricarboxylate transporter receptor subunit TctC